MKGATAAASDLSELPKPFTASPGVIASPVQGASAVTSIYIVGGLGTEQGLLPAHTMSWRESQARDPGVLALHHPALITGAQRAQLSAGARGGTLPAHPRAGVGSAFRAHLVDENIKTERWLQVWWENRPVLVQTETGFFAWQRTRTKAMTPKRSSVVLQW